MKRIVSRCSFLKKPDPQVADFPYSSWAIVSKETHFDHRISSIGMAGTEGERINRHCHVK